MSEAQDSAPMDNDSVQWLRSPEMLAIAAELERLRTTAELRDDSVTRACERLKEMEERSRAEIAEKDKEVERLLESGRFLNRLIQERDALLSETRAERDAARAEVAEAKAWKEDALLLCAKRRCANRDKHIAEIETERDAAVAFVAKFLECHGKFWSSERSYAELVAAARAIKKQES